MKIAYISIDDPKDYVSWSGLKLNMFKTLKNLDNDIIVIGPFKDHKRFPFVIKREILKLFNLKYDSERNNFLSQVYSKKIKKIIIKNKIDLIFTSDSYLVSHLDTNIPIVLWLDVTYKTYLNHYFKDKKFHKKSFQEANNLEKLALDKAKRIIVTSNWSKKETIKNYKISKNKIDVIPFGSNLLDKTININKFRKKNYIDLVSIGVDWKRKGMDKTINITRNLNKKGFKTRLKIIGKINYSEKFPKYISQIGFINKNIRKEHLKLIDILSNSDFHVLMTKKEACGVVFAEANSCGVFNITNDVGGVRGMIENNVNGKLFDPKDSENKVANFIIKTYKNKKKFYQLKKNSFNYYQKNLSWKVNASKLQEILLKAKNSV